LEASIESLISKRISVQNGSSFKRALRAVLQQIVSDLGKITLNGVLMRLYAATSE
jgi:hypothetical protein